MTQSARMTLQVLKGELKKRNISYKKIERHPDGSPKAGLLHRFGVPDQPVRPVGTEGRPGWGKGPVGSVLQGPPGPSGVGIPWLAGVSVYQSALWKVNAAGNKVPDVDKKGQQRAVRGMYTFRMVSSKHKGIKWQYPGIEGKDFFEKAEAWAKTQWDTVIVPELLRKFGVTS